MFYTHYSTYKNEIFLRYVDEDGKRKNGFFPFNPKYYLVNETQESDTKTIYGKNVTEKISDNVRSFYGDIKEYKEVSGLDVYGCKNPALQYVAKKFPTNLIDIFDRDKIRRFEIDIEVTTEKSVGFPDVVDPVEEINIISGYDNFYKKMVVFHTIEVDFTDEKFKDFDIYSTFCENEKELLAKFLNFWCQDYPDVVSGWNIGGFDVPFTINRMEKILGKTATKRLSPLEKIRKKEGYDDKGRPTFDYKIDGIEIVDTMLLYQKIELEPRESYSLEFISSYELGVGKLQHPSGVPGHLLYQEQSLDKIELSNDWGEWENHKQMILKYRNNNFEDHKLYADIQKEFKKAAVLYNILDVQRCYEVEEKKDLFAIAYFMAYYSYSNISEIISSMKFWSNLLYVFCYNDLNLVFKMHNDAGHKSEKFEGAYVRDPLVGLYKGPGCVVTYDVASMYPNILRVLNISPETLCNKRYDVNVNQMLLNSVPKFDERHAVGANGAAFDKSKMGVLPKKVEELFNKRKVEKGLAGKLYKEIEAINKELGSRGKDV